MTLCNGQRMRNVNWSVALQDLCSLDEDIVTRRHLTNSVCWVC